MPLHDIMQGIPMAIIAVIALQRSDIIDMPEASIGRMVQTMPSFVISKVMRHIMGIAIIGIPMPMPGMPLIMGMPIIGIPPPIIGMPIIGIPPPIIGMPPIMGEGFIPPMPFIIIGMGMGIIIGIPPDDGFIPFPIIGIALIGVIMGLLRPRSRTRLR
jgi:hypothetical protein